MLQKFHLLNQKGEVALFPICTAPLWLKKLFQISFSVTLKTLVSLTQDVKITNLEFLKETAFLNRKRPLITVCNHSATIDDPIVFGNKIFLKTKD